MNEFQNRDSGFQQQQPWAGLSSGRVQSAAEATVAERLAFIRKVYALLFASSIFGVVGVGIGFAFPPLMIAMAQHPWISLIALLGAVMGVQSVRLVPRVNLLALFGFTTFTGLMIS